MKLPLSAGLLFVVLITATRVPIAPAQLFTFDDVNFAYSLGDFNIEQSQPQPPGYPLFVLEMHALEWLRFRRPESILLALSVVTSIASCLALLWTGIRMFNVRVGWIAALLLAVHPAFWFTGLTSAVRINLAFVSAVVAGACWKAWCGDGRAALASGVLLGLGAGLRPEIGPLLVPLWAIGLWRAETRWPGRCRNTLVLAASVLVWLVPLIADTGGPAKFAHLLWSYLTAQGAGLTSPVLGADVQVWQTAAVWLVVWSLCGLLAIPLPAALSWTRKSGFEVGRLRAGFMLVWFLPVFAFAASVHVADTGHVLALVPPVCLVSAHLIDRAALRLQSATPLLLVPVVAALPAAIVWAEYAGVPELSLWTIAAGGAVAGLLLRIKPKPSPGWISGWQAAALLTLPAVALSLDIFVERDWYHEATAQSPVYRRLRRDLHSGLRYLSYELIRETTNRDDHAIQAVRPLVSHASAVIVSDRGIPGWRKLSYYFPNTPIIVVETGRLKLARGPDVRDIDREVMLPSSPARITSISPAGIESAVPDPQSRVWSSPAVTLRW